MGVTVELVLPLALFVIMAALGLGLSPADFRRIALQPRDFVTGLTAQMLLLPLVAFVIATVWSPPPALAIGLMIIAVAPGGVTSNLLTRYAGGDTALSVSLTAVTSLASIVMAPLVVVAAIGHFGAAADTGGLSVAGIALRMFAMVAVPVALGMALRLWRPALARRIEPAAGRISALLFALVLAAAIWGERDNILAFFAAAGLATLSLNLAMMAIAFWGAILIGCRRPQRIALSLECGLQNGTLALAIVAALGLGPAYATPAAIYSLLMFVTALGFVALIRRAAPARDVAA